ncbi:MAG: NAD-dependent epimerase/dehydratase family protein, partial [Candidatus Paceibacterota bacterium]
MNLLITGGSGFVGSNLAIRFKKLYPSWTVLALDNLKRRGSELNVPRLRNNGVQFIHGDIRNSEDFDTIGDVDCIIDAESEPTVTEGLDSNKDYVVNTNLMGTINCLNFAVKRKAMFIFLSSSRIYPFDLLDQVKFEEKETRFEIIEDQVLPGISNKGVTLDFPLRGPKSLYGATKLSSELLMTEYNEFLNL